MQTSKQIFHPFKSFALSGIGLIALGSNAALAGAFGLHEQSAEALGVAFAGVAAGEGGLSSMFWNPATLTKSPGIEISASGSLLIPYLSDKNTTVAPSPISALPSPGNLIQPVLLPAGYFGYQFSDQWWAGVAVNTPFGLSTKNPTGSAPGLWGLTTSVFTTEITPQIAFKLNDMVSFGVGVQAEYMEVRETTLASLAPALAGEVRGTSWGFGFTAGLTLTPMKGTEFGIGYRSAVREGLKGRISSFAGGLPFSTSVTAPLTLPDSVSVGLRQAIGSQFTLLAGAEWTNWSRVQSLIITSTGAVALPPIPAGTTLAIQNLRYRDGWMFSLGGEYALDANWTLRGGAAYEISPITNATRDVRLLDSDRIWLTLGASYKVSSKLKFDISYAHLFYMPGTITIPAGSTTPAVPLTYTGNSSGNGDIVSVGLTYRWDEPASPAVVAKY